MKKDVVESRLVCAVRLGSAADACGVTNKGIKLSSSGCCQVKLRI